MTLPVRQLMASIEIVCVLCNYPKHLANFLNQTTFFSSSLIEFFYASYLITSVAASCCALEEKLASIFEDDKFLSKEVNTFHLKMGRSFHKQVEVMLVHQQRARTFVLRK